jgi:hypothetical protein
MGGRCICGGAPASAPERQLPRARTSDAYAGLEEAAEHDVVERGASAASQEAVQLRSGARQRASPKPPCCWRPVSHLHKQLKVDVVGLGLGAAGLLVATASAAGRSLLASTSSAKIDTLRAGSAQALSRTCLVVRLHACRRAGATSAPARTARRAPPTMAQPLQRSLRANPRRKPQTPGYRWSCCYHPESPSGFFGDRQASISCPP